MEVAHLLCGNFSSIPAASSRYSSSSIVCLIANGTDLGFRKIG